ncbi:MAG TPA: hypothetical protein PKH39_00675 [Woeseiaceae bacterium]|nr:hypothetical protein [Woeseiaceae bacterium]
MIDGCRKRLQAGVAGEGTPPTAVALAVEQALFDKHPRDRYLVVPEQVEAGWTIAKSIEELLALNVGHEYSFSRNEIVEMIDAMWPFASGEKSWDDAEDEAAMDAYMNAWMERRSPAPDPASTTR